ncbi:MAG: adenylate/guanylate cyclase domain-containing protein [Pseudomonadota bacterium]
MIKADEVNPFRVSGDLDPSPRNYPPAVNLLQRRVFQLDLSQTTGPADIENWLLDDASRIESTNAFIEAFAGRLVLAQLGVARLSLNVGTLHPQIYGYAWNWSILDGICDEVQIGEESLSSDAYRRNPLFRAIEFGEAIRIRLDAALLESESQLMNELTAEGYSEYMVFPLAATGKRRNAVTLATQQPGGFDEHQYETLQGLLKIFALHVQRHIANRTTKNISYTYLGSEAGENVVKGSIKRGSGLPIKAIIWSSDMRGFSKLAEKLTNREMSSVLDCYFSILAESVIHHGGDVLKFIGDGMLAVFPFSKFEDENGAANAAIAAAGAAIEKLRQLNADQNTLTDVAGWRPLQTGIALHRGEVFFGNVGSPHRLDFTVIGKAVNEASRIEGLCKETKCELLISEPVARLADRNLRSIGDFQLRGMAEQISLFTTANQ